MIPTPKNDGLSPRPHRAYILEGCGDLPVVFSEVLQSKPRDLALA
jgi:hypothetical protein